MEAIIGMGIASISLVGVVQLMQGLGNSSRHLDSRISNSSVTQSLQVYLSSEKVCSESVQAENLLSSLSAPIAFDLKGVGTFKAGQKNEALKTEIDALTLNNAIELEKNPLGLSLKAGILEISFSSVNANGQKIKHKPFVIGTLSLVTSETGKILKCKLGSLQFQSVPQQVPINPLNPTAQIEGHNGGGNNNASVEPPNKEDATEKCQSIEQCAVYDYFIRNGYPDPYASANAWMKENSNWKGIAKSYVDSMTGLGKLNLLSSVNTYGLVQTGRNIAGEKPRPNTIDQWVAEAVANDPSGRSMLTTAGGIKTLELLFDGGDSVPENTQNILRTALSQNADLTMNSSLGIGTWVKALGYSSAQEMAKAQPGVAISAALNPASSQDASAVKEVIEYMKNNPAESVKIANGTGLWAKNLNGGVDGVINYIASNFAASGNNQEAIQIAKVTDQYAKYAKENGAQVVGAAISRNAADALAIAKGTAVWNNTVGEQTVNSAISSNIDRTADIARGTADAERIFGANAVTAAITNNRDIAAEQAAAIARAKRAGHSDAEIKKYIEANPNTFQEWGK